MNKKRSNKSTRRPENSAEAYLRKPYGRTVVPEDDGTFRAEILEFPGCIATGKTETEALTNLRDVAESWVEAAIELGQSIPEPFNLNGYSGKFVVRMPRTLHKKAAYFAERNGVSLNNFVNNCVAECVGAQAKLQQLSAGHVVATQVTQVKMATYSTVPANSRFVSPATVFVSYLENKSLDKAYFDNKSLGGALGQMALAHQKQGDDHA